MRTYCDCIHGEKLQGSSKIWNNTVLYGPPIYFELGNQEHNGNLQWSASSRRHVVDVWKRATMNEY